MTLFRPLVVSVEGCKFVDLNLHSAGIIGARVKNEK